jgi:tRNA A-37 threonylcarbamoyl transferase component Bud32
MSDIYRVLRGDDWAPWLRECLPAPPAEMLPWMEQHTRLLKSDTYSRVGLLRVQGQACCLKLYIAKSALQNLGFRFAYGRGIHSFDAASRLLEAGIMVPAPRTCVRIPDAMLLLTQGMEDSCDLRALWLAQPAEEASSMYMRRAGETLCALHLAGFAHGDCKWSNLLWTSEAFYLVDLEDVRSVRAPGAQPESLHALQLQDIARFTADAERLCASPRQYEIFLESYCASLRYPREKLLDQITQPVAVIRNRHERKSGRINPALL